MNYRALLIKVVTFLGGAYFLIDFILPKKIGSFQFSAYDIQMMTAFAAIGIMAIGLGLINLLWVHGSKIAFLRRGWVHSSALLIGLLLMLSITGLEWRSNTQIEKTIRPLTMLSHFAEAIHADVTAGKVRSVPAEKRMDIFAAAADQALQELLLRHSQRASELSAETALMNAGSVWEASHAALAPELESFRAAPTPEHLPVLAQKLSALAQAEREIGTLLREKTQLSRAYDLLYNKLFVALGSAMFSLLGFYIAAAAYRAFRIRSVESGLMLGAALLVMLGQIPFGIWIWDQFPAVRLWILQTPNAAAFRAIAIGAGVASLVLAFRMLFSIESKSFAERK